MTRNALILLRDLIDLAGMGYAGTYMTEQLKARI
jgi:hypothetical protein